MKPGLEFGDLQKSNLYHCISFFPCLSKMIFISRKWLFQRKPLCAENGEGCADSNIKCLLQSISAFFFWAKAHQRTKIIHSCEFDIFLSTASVKSSHQIFAWLAGFFSSTVRILLRSNTHCSAQCSKLPEFPAYPGYSFAISLYMFLKLGGILTHSCTEKLSPWACHLPWYGSCPRITILNFSTGVMLNARNIFSFSGNIFFQSFSSCSKKVQIFWKYCFCSSSQRRSCQDSSIFICILSVLIIIREKFTSQSMKVKFL